MKKIYVVGIGPGDNDMMTVQAQKALADSDVIVGYPVYLDLIRDRYADKEFLSTPMKKEVDRCRMCFEQALAGKTTSIVCSGDAGIYGMASLILELSEKYDACEIEIVPGITAACSGSAVLGAPLSHDFCVISLSDLLTPWELIERRLESAAAGDFVIAIYNPSSVKRHDYLNKACQILMRKASPDTACGYVQNIGRDGQTCITCTLKELADKEVDMFTTVFVGNSRTKVIDGKLVTPRGYL